MNKSLKNKLIDYLLENEQHLSQIYKEFSEEKKDSIRGRLNENIGRCFKRISKGVYASDVGNSRAVIIEGDAWEEVRKMKDNSIDCIITDSPYTCLDKHYNVGSTRQRNRDKSVGFETKDIDKELLEHMFRVLKDGSHFFSFLPSDGKDTIEYNDNFIEMAKDVGFEFNKRAIWDKKVIGMGYNLRNRYEQIIFLSKGKRRKPFNFSIPDVLTHKRIPAHKRIHPAQKPNGLIADLIKFSTIEEDTLLDLFAGSMVLAEECLKLNRNCICVEKDKEVIDKAIKGRMENDQA